MPETTFQDVPRGERRYGEFNMLKGGLSDDGGVLLDSEGRELLELFSTPRTMHPGDTGWIYMVGHEPAGWEWDWTTFQTAPLWKVEWFQQNVLQKDNFDTSLPTRYGWTPPILKWMVSPRTGIDYVEHIINNVHWNDEVEFPYEVRIRVDVPEGEVRGGETQILGLGGMFNLNSNSQIGLTGQTNMAAGVDVVIGPDEGGEEFEFDVVAAIAGEDGTVGFDDVLAAISAFNTESELAGHRVGYQDVLAAIKAYNES